MFTFIGMAFAVACSILGLAGIAWLGIHAWGRVVHRTLAQRDVNRLVRTAIAFKIRGDNSEADAVRQADEHIWRTDARKQYAAEERESILEILNAALNAEGVRQFANLKPETATNVLEQVKARIQERATS